MALPNGKNGSCPLLQGKKVVISGETARGGASREAVIKMLNSFGAVSQKEMAG